MNTPGPLHIRRMSKADFDFLRETVNEWWGRDVSTLLHPMFLNQFGDTAYVAEQDTELAGFIVGVISQRNPVEAYIHLVCTAPKARGRGIARKLYEIFFAATAARGCGCVRSITQPSNKDSIAFHQCMGFTIVREGAIEVDGVWAVTDYAGPGKHRVMFERTIQALRIAGP